MPYRGFSSGTKRSGIPLNGLGTLLGMPAQLRRKSERIRWALALFVVPLCLFLPLILGGEVFLPMLPVAHAPLSMENPGAAAEAVRDQNPIVGDRILPFLTDQYAMRDEVQRGSLPTWEPYLGLGMPLIGQSATGGFYPPNALALLIPPEKAAAILAVLALTLAGMGTWLFLRRIGLDRRACLIGAIAQQLGTWGLVNLALPMKIDAALWFPWALWAVEGVVRRRKGSILWLSVSLGLSFLGGMVAISVFVFAATALYALVRLEPLPFHFAPRSRDSGLGPPLVAVCACGLGLLIGCLQLLPLKETSENSLRKNSQAAEIEAGSLPITTLAGIVVPDLTGRPNDSTAPNNLPLAWWLTPAKDQAKAESANILEWNTHAGVILFLLALTAVIAVPKRAVFPAALIVCVFAFAQGWFLVRELYVVPGLNLGVPGRALALCWTLWAWLAGLGTQALIDRQGRALWTFLSASFFLAATGFSLWSVLDPPTWAADLHQTIVERYHESAGITLPDAEARLPPEMAQEAGRHLKESYARMAAAALGAFVAGCLGLLADRNRARFEKGAPISLLIGGALLGLAITIAPALITGAPVGSRGLQMGLALVALLVFLPALPWPQIRMSALWLALLAGLLGEGMLGSKVHVEGRKILSDGVFPPSASIESVREAAGDGRVLRLDPTESLAHSQLLARSNLLQPYGIRDISAYPTFTPATHAELFGALDSRSVLINHVARLPSADLLEHPILDLARAQAILSVEALEHPRLTPVLERPSFHVYKRSGALPPARIVTRAHVVANDNETLEALVAGSIDFEQTTWVAAEYGDVVAGITSDSRSAPDQARITSVEFPQRNRATVNVENADGGWLVLHEQWAPGWKAFHGERELPLVRADHVYRAVPLPSSPAGDSISIQFVYRPESLRLGFWLCLGGLACALLLDFFYLRKGRRSLI